MINIEIILRNLRGDTPVIVTAADIALSVPPATKVNLITISAGWQALR